MPSDFPITEHLHRVVGRDSILVRWMMTHDARKRNLAPEGFIDLGSEDCSFVCG